MTAFYGLRTLDNQKIPGIFLVVFASKHRLCDTTKAKLIRNTPETFKDLGLSQQSAFCPQKAMLAVLNHSEIKLNADTSRLKSSITTYCPFANSIHFPSP